MRKWPEQCDWCFSFDNLPDLFADDTNVLHAIEDHELSQCQCCTIDMTFIVWNEPKYQFELMIGTFIVLNEPKYQFELIIGTFIV